MADILWAAAVVTAILLATVGLGFLLVVLLGLGDQVSAKYLTPKAGIKPGWAPDDPLSKTPGLRNGVTRL